MVPEMEQKVGETTDKTTNNSFKQYIEEVRLLPVSTPVSKHTIQLRNLALISQEALNLITSKTWGNSHVVFTLTPLGTPPQEPPATVTPSNIKNLCALITHPVSGKLITSYKKLAQDPITREIWMNGFGKE